MHLCVNYSTIYNNQDMEGKPSNFLYINDCVHVCMYIMIDTMYYSCIVKKTMVHVMVEKNTTL